MMYFNDSPKIIDLNEEISWDDDLKFLWMGSLFWF